MSSLPLASGMDGDDVVVLVDQDDAVLGVAPKLQVHREGRLHRAVSVVLFDENGRVLLQRRAAGKYHSGGLWSNTCCGHPRPGEAVTDAARRRLAGELGIAGCDLTAVGHFLYRADVGDGLVEHELDHVVVGRWAGHPVPDPLEVSDTRWIAREPLLAALDRVPPGEFTVWAASVIRYACRFGAETLR